MHWTPAHCRRTAKILYASLESDVDRGRGVATDGEETLGDRLQRERVGVTGDLTPDQEYGDVLERGERPVPDDVGPAPDHADEQDGDEVHEA